MKLTDPETPPIETETDRLEGKVVMEGIENEDTIITGMQSATTREAFTNLRRSTRDRKMIIVPEKPVPKAVKQNKPPRVPKAKKVRVQLITPVPKNKECSSCGM